MSTRPKTRIPSDRKALLALHTKYGSWSAVARALQIDRSLLEHRVDRAGLTNDPTLDHSVAQRRLRPEHQWMLDRDELRRNLQQHGSPHGLFRATGINRDSLQRYIRKHGLTPEDWTPDPADYGVRRYDTPLVLQGDWVIASDFQVPFVSRKMVQLLCKIGQAWKIPNLLLAGDFLDLQHFSKFDPIDEPPDWETSKRLGVNLLRTLSDAFPGEKVWLLGNHEIRITRLTKGKWTIQELASAFEAHDIRAVQAPLVQIETPRGIWDVVHPKSFSVIPSAVGKDLAHKSRHHIITAHGHAVAYRRDYSGESECVDLGCMCDPGTLAYVHLFPTRHPVMRQGFCLLDKGHVYQIQPDSNISFWVKAGAAR